MMTYLIDDKQLPADVLDRVRARRQAMLARLEELSAKDGKVLFELEWLTPLEARRRHRGLRWRSWQSLLELLVLYLLVFAGTVLVGRLLIWLLGL